MILSRFSDDVSLSFSDVPPCFATILMKVDIQRHRVEVQGRTFASETAVIGGVTSSLTHMWKECGAAKVGSVARAAHAHSHKPPNTHLEVTLNPSCCDIIQREDVRKT